MIELLSLPYSRVRWSTLLRQMFGRYDEREVPLELDPPSDGPASRIIQLGTITVAGSDPGETKSLAVIEIEASDLVDLIRNRVGLRQTAARLLSPGVADGLLVVTTQPGLETWRFTFVSREVRLDDELRVVRTETAPRRFTYLLGPHETCRTASERFEVLAGKVSPRTLADVISAFDVEPVSKEFFTRYKEHYKEFCKHILENTDAATRVFGLSLEGLEGKALDRELKPVRDFVKKLLGRLVFLHFLQKKGWLGCDPTRSDWQNGAPNFLRQLFDSTPEEEKDRFHSTRLAPLFFETLNAPNRPDDLFAVNGTRVPYLNGGLFERDFPLVEQLDFPASLFAALLEFFGQYHFTIDENDPEDHEIGIDPEMLGHIFENLLEDNKDKGAYYTPKAVVQYMCQQSLIHALTGHFPGDPAARNGIEALIRTKEPIDARRETWLSRHATQLSTLLDDLRICDPAIGSGAFPIGLLQEIYWTKLAINSGLDRAATKRAIIQRSIHGVDLDAGAVEIARLRFWLALIVEETAPLPLPNLDYQIMQGNSLLESFEGERLDDLYQPMRAVGRQRLGSDAMELNLGGTAHAGELTVTIHTPAQHNLAALREEYYACHEPTEKAALRSRIDDAVLRAIDDRLRLRREELTSSLRAINLLTGRAFQRGEEKKRAVMQAELDALTGKSARLHALLEDPRAERPFFLWHLWFRHVLAEPPEGRGGFDIVIANPPYVRHEAIRNLKHEFKGAFGEYFTGTADLFVYFYHIGITLLREGGTLCFISSNKFLRAGYGRNLRGLLRDSTRIKQVIDFGELPVFAAGTDPAILIVSKDTPLYNHHLETAVIKNVADIDQLTQAVEIRKQSRPQHTLQNDGWTLENSAVLSLLAKLRRVGRPLNDVVSGRFYYGIKTGLNDAFVIDRATRDRLIAEDNSSTELLKPFVHGSDAKKWCVELRDEWLIYVPWHFPLHLDNSVSGASNAAEILFKDRYPAIYKHLLRNKPELLKRNTAETCIRYEWYALQRWGAEYWQEFEQPKIIFNETSKEMHAFFDETGLYTNKTLFMLVAPEPKPLLAILLCRTLDWLFRHEFPSWGDPWKGGRVQFRGDRMATVPIPDFTSADQATLTALVDRILVAKSAGDTATVATLEAEIDMHVFRLYGLTSEEVHLIQNSYR